MLHYIQMAAVIFMSYSLCNVCKISTLLKKMIPGAHRLAGLLTSLSVYSVCLFALFLFIFFMSKKILI